MMISGVPRSFGTNLWPFVQEVSSLAGTQHTIDVYISFPKSSTTDRFYNTQSLTHEALCSHPIIRTIKYEDDCSFSAYKENLREHNIVTQWYRIVKLFEDLPHNTYDCVIRCRPDVQFICSPSDFLYNIIQKQSEKIITIPKGFDIFDHKLLHTYPTLENSTVNDQVAWGSYETMKKYCSVFTWIQSHIPKPLLSEAALYSVLTDSDRITIQRILCPYNLRISQCFSFAICGESGAGKSTLSKLLQDILPFDQTLLLETDRYHKWERGAKEYQTYTHYHPEANHLEKLAEDAYSLHLGEDIFTVDYDHDTGKFTEPKQIESANYMILCGLHTLYKDSIRDFIDLKIYLDTEESLTQEWKVERDMRERGANRETILRAIEKRRDDFLKYIAPQKEHADILIQFRKESESIHLRIGIQNETLLSIATNILIKYCPFVSKESSIHWFTCITPPSNEVVSTDAKTLGYSGRLPLAQGFNGLLQLLCICIVWKPLTTT